MTHALLATSPDRICFAGDWHANTRFACGRIMSAAAQGAEVLLHVGDFGFWHGDGGRAYLDGVEKVAARVGLPVLFIDGNHEDHNLLAQVPQVAGLGQVRDHIWHIPRGTRWEWAGLRWGGLGGATSVDKLTRTPMLDWWPQEALTTRDVARWLDGGPVDVAITHDAPGEYEVPGVTRAGGISFWGSEAIYTAEAHRLMLADALEPTRPGLVVHGHFHLRYELTWNYPGGRARVIGLDCDNYLPTRNTWVVDLDEVAQIVSQSREGL